MGEPTPEDVEAIVARDMPGWRVRRSTANASAAGPAQIQADAVTPDIDTLRRKYLGDAAPMIEDDEEAEMSGDVSESRPVVREEAGLALSAGEGYSGAEQGTARSSQGSAGDAEDVLVVVEPEDEPDTFHQGPGPKGVIVSPQTGSVIGSQG